MESVHQAINERYGILAEQECCISCGGAINYAQVQPGEVCIDLGSGRGTDVVRMAQAAGSEGFAYGIDISEGMLKKARRTAAKLSVSNVEFIACPLEQIALPDNCADVIISNCTINHAGDKAAVWRQIFRILKKGGRFSVSDIYSCAPVPEQYRTDPQAVAECWAGAIEKHEYLDIIAACGFTNVSIVEESTPYPKGAIEVASFTIRGTRPACCCGAAQ